MKKLTSILMIMALALLINGLANATVLSASGSGYRQIDFIGESIPTGSTGISNKVYDAGSYSRYVIRVTASGETISTANVKWLSLDDSTVLLAETVSVNTVVTSIYSTMMNIAIMNPSADAVIAVTGSILLKQ